MFQKVCDVLRIRGVTVGFLACGFVYSLSTWSSAATALVAGVAVATITGNPFSDQTRIYSRRLLSWSIVGLGAGINLISVGEAGLSGLGLTFISIAMTLTLGVAIGRMMKADRETSTLIAIGTAICGGSAIAAIAPVMKAKPQAIAVAMGTVFILNAVALLLFPSIGHYFDLSQRQFGVWSALAIHDTSSVVGVGLQYGNEALQIGTTVKLARALWIVPLTMGFGFFYHDVKAEHAGTVRKPWFILGFLVMAALVTWVPEIHNIGRVIESIAHKSLIVTLFLIGSNLTRATLQSVGIKPFLQGFSLWLIVSVSTLIFIKYNLL